MGNSHAKDYNHSEKAGNSGDVWKHFILTVLARNISLDSDSIHYVDCHAVAPVHDLSKGSEWQHGVKHLIDNATNDNAYMDIVKKYWPEKYPSGWLIVANVLAERYKRVQVSLFDNSELVEGYYSDKDLCNLKNRGYLPENVEVTFCKDDGFTRAADNKDKDLIFLDPPFFPDADKDWNSLTETCKELKCQDQSFAAWYPFSGTKVRELLERTQCEAWQVSWPDCESNLKGCGILLSDSLATLVKGREQCLKDLTGSMDWKLD
ncbi:MAG: 23S rRNA (adenine(2030)-N(6))-methyltransferase RlmJ [Gammaproteobacteria bacterium]|nr:23S rRNA (adenine(2030)-N(6))-methyltransferase RlmJ [Gammaproteobacteria bacterium]